MNPDPKAKTNDASMSGRPENWDRDQVRRDEGEPERDVPAADDEVPTWNEDQMARQRQDGTRSPGLSEEEIESSKGGLSGGGVNPGGGERWAERDDEKSKK
jgi:hypothetical protein